MKSKYTVILLLLIEMVCLISYFFHDSSEKSGIENRNLMTFDMVINNPPSEDSVVYKPTASERFEEALQDQFFGRDWVTIHYANYTAFLDNVYSKSRKSIATVFNQKSNIEESESENIKLDYDRWPGYGLPRLERIPAQDYSMSKIGTFYRFNDTDYIFNGPAVKAPGSFQLKTNAERIRHIHDLYPDINIYGYFVSALRHTRWFDSELGYNTPDFHESIAQAMPEYMKVNRLVIHDETEYKKLYYKSDHHWNYKGSMQGYEDIYNMISEDYNNLPPLKTPEKIWNFTEQSGFEFRGSRSRVLQELYNGYDEFIVPEYDLGNRSCYSIDLETGKETPVTLGLWDIYKADKMPKDRYRNHYGDFYRKVSDKDGNVLDGRFFYLIRNESLNTGHNLLMITDSTGFAIRDALGSHFDSMVFLYYEDISKVKIDEIIEKYDIDTIVMNGIGPVWTQKTCNLRFSDGFGEKEE